MRKGWAKQYVMVCGYKMLFYDEGVDKNDVPTTLSKLIIDIR